jgi:hypothetical protein
LLISRTLVLEDSIPTVIAKPGVHDLIRDTFWLKTATAEEKENTTQKGNITGITTGTRCTYAILRLLRLLRLPQDGLWSHSYGVTFVETNNATNIEGRAEICILGFDICAQNSRSVSWYTN